MLYTLVHGIQHMVCVKPLYVSAVCDIYYSIIPGLSDTSTCSYH